MGAGCGVVLPFPYSSLSLALFKYTIIKSQSHSIFFSKSLRTHCNVYLIKENPAIQLLATPWCLLKQASPSHGLLSCLMPVPANMGKETTVSYIPRTPSQFNSHTNQCTHMSKALSRQLVKWLCVWACLNVATTVFPVWLWGHRSWLNAMLNWWWTRLWLVVWWQCVGCGQRWEAHSSKLVTCMKTHNCYTVQWQDVWLSSLWQTSSIWLEWYIVVQECVTIVCLVVVMVVLSLPPCGNRCHLCDTVLLL